MSNRSENENTQPTANELAAVELIAAAKHYVKLKNDPSKTPFIRENGRHGETSPWAELVAAVRNHDLLGSQ